MPGCLPTDSCLRTWIAPGRLRLREPLGILVVGNLSLFAGVAMHNKAAVQLPESRALAESP